MVHNGLIIKKTSEREKTTTTWSFECALLQSTVVLLDKKVFALLCFHKNFACCSFLLVQLINKIKRVLFANNVHSVPKIAKSNATMDGNSKNTNYFSPLEVDDESDLDCESVQDQTNKNNNNKNKPRVPPVVLPNSSRKDVSSLLKCANVVNFKLKLMSIGIKVFFDDAKERIDFVETLKSKNINFFSYADKENRPLKYVISGLDRYATSDVMNELLANDLPCFEVKEIKLKHERFNSQTNYLAFFKKGAVTFANLKKCKSLFSTIIYWSPWRRKVNSITQCYRCQMFGHGEVHCHLPAKCQKCSGLHATSACNIAQLKCVNCGGKHISSDPECPKRKEYINILKNVQQRTLRGRRSLPQQNKIAVNDNSFPQLSHPNLPTGAASSKRFAMNSVTSYADSVKFNTSQDDLFTPNELFTITRELLASLRKAATKEDQILAVAAIVTKYVYNV